MENCTVWRSETARRFSPNYARFEQRQHEKVEAKGEPTKNVSVVGALVTSERTAEPRLISMEDNRNLHPKEKVLELTRKKIRVPSGIIDLGSFEVLSDHGDAEDDGDVDEF